VFTARDCAMGIVVQNNSTFQAPFATFTLNHNTHAGLVLLSQGTFSFGGSIVAKNNSVAGIFVDEGSSFSAFINLVGSSAITLEDNGQAGVSSLRGSSVELSNVVANKGAIFGVFVDEGSVRIGRAKISDNKKADVRLQFGARATLLDGAEVGVLSCDGSELLRGAKTPCTSDPKPTAAKVEKP